MIFRDTYNGITERMIEQDGKLIINRSQDVQALIERNKAEAEILPSKYGEAAWRKVGSIPLTLAEAWAKECGANIGTKEFAIYAKKKLMDGEFAAFRIKGV
ncbi:MAG: hypothetical protein EAZ84_00400 [Verrucomicrobia bacterium]|jgi:hypothetical protein|nr:MAG: hypothetical protein EAZ84_00400 [Verrucomicrobiota bacterium]